MNANICTCVLAVAVCMPLMAQTPDLSGTWQSQSNGAQKWVLDQKSDKIHIKEMEGDKVEADFTCSLYGQECPVKLDGRSEKITMYFNGDKLVELHDRGSETIKQRLAVSADGKTLTVETVPLSSDQKVETESFSRQSS
jgi:uncharacterized protein YycO